MTDPKSDSSSLSTEINFTLSVDALMTGNKVSKISFNLDLNPDDRILAIGEYLSSRAGLAAIFKDLDRVLDEIARRTEVYNSMISVKPVEGFDEKYIENMKPTFGKIESIDYRHESPGAANVMYARRYNGDLQPPSL